MSDRSARTFEVRHLQLVRAVLAAAAAILITFSSDHSAPVGLRVFAAFAFATGIVWLLAARLVVPGAGGRGYRVTMALLCVVGGAAAVFGAATDTRFFVTVVLWAAVTGAVELAIGWRATRDARRQPPTRAHETDATESVGGARDSIVVGALGILLAAGLLIIPSGYSLAYSVPKAGDFTLTGIIIGVGVLGGYTAILAVYLGIAGLSPARRAPAPAPVTTLGEAP